MKLDEFKSETAKNNSPEDGTDNPKSAESGKLGLDLQPLTPELSKRLELPAGTKGMIVVNIDPEGPAASEGIIKGDVILEINRQPIESFEQVQAALEKSGDRPALLLVNRGNQTVFITVQPKQ